MISLLALLGLPVALLTTHAQTFSETPSEKFWETDGPVNAIADGGEVVYLGGSFGYAGPYTGCAVALDTKTAAVNPSFPRVEGEVDALVPDGNGGWFLGGSFARVAGQPQSYLTHLRADRTVDPNWKVELEVNGPFAINTLAVYSGTLYFAGDFIKVAGEARANLAAVDATSGALRPWNPAPSGQYQGIRALKAHNGLIYVGGDFTSIGGESHAGLAALDPITAKPAAWNPSMNGTVVTIAAVGTVVYIGGFFSQVETEVRNLIAAVDADSGVALAWNPNASGTTFTMVESIVPDGDTIYVGGYFTAIGGQARVGLAALDRITGQATPWNPRCDGLCTALTVGQGVVYAGGAFNQIGGQRRWHLAALDPVTADALDWNPHAGGYVSALALAGDQLLAGGLASSYGGEFRQGLVALNKQTGQATAWNPDLGASGIIHGTMLALAVADDSVYVGGKSSLPNGLPTGNLFAVDRVTAQVTTLPQPNFDVRALVIHQGLLYFGGLFNRIGADVHRRLAALDLATGSLTGWNPDVRSAVTGGTSYINSLALGTNTLFAGGNFGTVGGLPRNSLVAFDLGTGVPTDWVGKIPAAVSGDGIKTLGIDQQRLWVGGVFAPLNSGGLFAIDTASGELGSFNAGAVLGWFKSVNGVTPAGTLVYVAGESGVLPTGWNASRYRVAAFDDATGALGPWNPPITGMGNTVLSDGQFLYVGGDFDSVNGEARKGFVAFGVAQPAAPQIAAESVQFVPPNIFQFVITSVSGRTFTVQASDDLKQWTDLMTQTAGSNPVPFSDTNAPGTRRFYRIVLP